MILRRLPLVTVFLVLALVAGCVGMPGGTGDAKSEGGAGALETEAIAVTPLDGPEAPTATAPAPGGTPPAATDAATGAGGETEAATDPAEAPAEEVPPAPPKSPEQLACEKKGGSWASAGGAGAKACVRRTRDGGKQCTNGTQCEGECLARSRSCSPVTPLFGCNEILQDNGARMTQCIG